MPSTDSSSGLKCMKSRVQQVVVKEKLRKTSD